MADCRETLRGSDVIHQEKCLGLVENLFCDAAKPLKENKKCNQRYDVLKAGGATNATPTQQLNYFSHSHSKVTKHPQKVEGVLLII